MSLDLPMMKCDSGCSDCCGPVLCQEDEFLSVTGYARNRGIEPVRQGLTCPFYQGGTCQVYPVRPLVCRLFGHAENLTCSRGYNTNIPERRLASINRDYFRRGTPDRLLHEAAYSLDEIAGVIGGKRSLLQIG